MEYTHSHILALNFPLGCAFGIDQNIWCVGEKFRGVKNIPPGLHFVFYAAIDKNGQSTARKGFFEYLQSGEIYPLVWNNENEDIFMNMPESQLQNLTDRWRNDKSMTIEYPQDKTAEWLRLTHFSTKSTISRLGFTKIRIYIGPEFEVISSRLEKETPAELKLKQQLEQSDNLTVSLQFTEIPRYYYPPLSSPQQISTHYLDKSATLCHIVNLYGLSDKFYGSELLGELQVAFITFLYAGVYEGIEQWKTLITLFCNCDESVKRYSDLFSHFLECLRYQIPQLPHDFKDDLMNQHNFVKPCFELLYFTIMNQSSNDEQLVKQLNLLVEIMQSELGIDITSKYKIKSVFSEDDDDFKPTFVES